MISREKASRGFCALPVLRESRVFLFFSSSSSFFLFLVSVDSRGHRGFNRDCRWAEFEKKKRRRKKTGTEVRFYLQRGRNETTLVYYLVYFEVSWMEFVQFSIRKGAILTLAPIVIGFWTLETCELSNGNNRRQIYYTRTTFFCIKRF